MKKQLFLLLLWSIATSLMAQEGRVFDDLSLKSEILKTEKKYAIYLPPDYETSQRSYPVLYLLHGGGGNHIVWVQNGRVRSVADKAIKEGSAKPMIIVMPDAGGSNRGYANHPNGKWDYEDYFFEEFIPYIEETYRIRAGRRFRYIAGLSMGGNGTLIYALHHPEMFSAACPLSAGTWPLTMEQAKERLAERYPGVTETQTEEFYKKHGIIELINAIPEERKNAVRWYIDCGDDDAIEQVWEGNCMIHIAMRKREIPHEFRIRDGGHTWSYWRSALPEVLQFVSFTGYN